MSNPTLTTLDRVKRYLELETTDFDDLLNDLLVAASDQIRNWCRKDFSLADYVETYNGTRSPWLPLAVRPVKSVDYLNSNGSKVDTSKYVFTYTSIGLKDYQIFEGGICSYEVSYRAGYDVIPDDLQDACVFLVASKYREKDRIGITTKNAGTETISFEVSGLPERIKDVLKQYKDPALVVAMTSERTWVV